MYKWLNFGQQNLLHILSRDTYAKFSIPTNAEVSFYCEVSGADYLICDNVWAVAEGIKLLIQKPTEDAKQNQLFNRWKHTHTINCVFCI